MMTWSDETVREIVRDLAEGYGKQSTDTNRVWLALVAAAAVVLFPSASSEKDSVNLPFALGPVPTPIFYPIGFAILFVLTIAYCQAHAHAIKAAILGQTFLDKFEKSNPDAKPRDFYDILVRASFGRVWPLVDLLETSGFGQPSLARLYYIILKSLTLFLVLGIPVLALFCAYRRTVATAPTYVTWITFVLLFLAGVAVLQIIHAEFQYSRRVLAKLAKKYYGPNGK